MFRDANGLLYEFLKEIGRDMSACGRETPLAHFMRQIDLEAPWLITHLNELAKSDFDLLRQSKPNFHIIHCPRSHAYFSHSPFQFEKLREVGFNICLGTDSLASNDDLSLLAEMRAFQKKFPDVSPEEILKMVTVNAARALRQENSIGQIRTGFRADLMAIPVTKSTSVFDEIVGFDRPVSWSMVGSRISA